MVVFLLLRFLWESVYQPPPAWGCILAAFVLGFLILLRACVCHILTEIDSLVVKLQLGVGAYSSDSDGAAVLSFAVQLACSSLCVNICAYK